MGKYDTEELSSDSDRDELLRDDIEALSRACMPTNTLSDAVDPSTSSAGAGNDPYFSEDDDIDDLELLRSVKEKYGDPSTSSAGADGYFSEDADDSDLDDLELIRSIKEKYGDVAEIKPIVALPPDASDDDEDDFETVRAIKRRFSQYEGHVAGDGGFGRGGHAGDDAMESNGGSCIDKLLSSDAVCESLRNETWDEHRDNAAPDVGDSAQKEGASTSTSTFPRAAQTFIEAIKKNRSCQKFIRSKMLHIEARMEEIKDLQKRLKTLRDFQVQCKKKIGRALSQKLDARIQLISAPKQRANVKGAEKNFSAMAYGPPENSHVASYKAALTKFPLSFQREKWSVDERQNLEKGIIQKYQEMLLLRKSADVQSASEESGFANGVDGMMSSIRSHDITPGIIQQFSAKVNWEQLASLYLPRRTGAECEARWLNYENRLINRDYWTLEEDKKLLSILQENGVYNWSRVAEKLGTNRTPFHCLARYQRSLNAMILKRDWTEDEDVQLRSAVESFGESNWQAVASVLEGRTGTQCSNRWKKTLHPARERVGKWNDDEDKRLRVAVALFGKSWHRIADFVPGRTQAQCRERWVNVLDPLLNRGEWTEEEDSKLKAAIEEHGYCWSKVAACVPLRTDNQCRRRWKRLFPHEVPLLKEARNIQKKALISNFVDRESERPALGPKDFVPLPIEGSRNEQENDNALQKRNKSRKCRKRDTTEELAPTCSLKGVNSRKRRRRDTSLETGLISDRAAEENNGRDGISENKKKMISKSCSKIKKYNAKAKKKSCRSTEVDKAKVIIDCGAEQNSDRDDVPEYKKRMISKSASKKKKYSATKAKPRSYESRDSDETSETHTWDIPIGMSLRRLQRVRSKGNPSNGGYNVSLGSSICSDVNMSTHIPCLEQDNDFDVWHDQSSLPDSQVNIIANEVEVSDMEAMAGRLSCSRMSPERRSLSETTLGNDNCLPNVTRKSSDGTQSHWVDEAESSKGNAQKHKKRKLDTDQSEEWEHLPLSVLFNESFTCIWRKSSWG